MAFWKRKSTQQHTDSTPAQSGGESTQSAEREIRALFAPWRAQHERVAWRPIIAPGDETSSFFGGAPATSNSADWPMCVGCEEPMSFLLQLDLATLPDAMTVSTRSGMIQLFYCSTDDGMCETWAPFNGTAEVRLITTPVPIAAPTGLALFAKKAIGAWDAEPDYPHPPEHGLLGMKRRYDFATKTVTVISEAPPIQAIDLPSGAVEFIAAASSGDKLGGWPHWIQGVEYPACPDCGDAMALFMQLDSHCGLEHNFGDNGCAHLTQCLAHPAQFAFGWACG